MEEFPMADSVLETMAMRYEERHEITGLGTAQKPYVPDSGDISPFIVHIATAMWRQTDVMECYFSFGLNATLVRLVRSKEVLQLQAELCALPKRATNLWDQGQADIRLVRKVMQENSFTAKPHRDFPLEETVQTAIDMLTLGRQQKLTSLSAARKWYEMAVMQLYLTLMHHPYDNFRALMDKAFGIKGNLDKASEARLAIIHLAQRLEDNHLYAATQIFNLVNDIDRL
jgi:hypothetical protein